MAKPSPSTSESQHSALSLGGSDTDVSLTSGNSIVSSHLIDGPFQSPVPPSSPSTKPTEKRRIRTDLGIGIDQYIPLGSIVIRFDVADGDGWNELTSDTLPLPLLDHVVFDQITRLFQAGWIRLFVRAASSDKGVATVRIYLLPDDVGRSILPRNDKKLRSSLRALMVNVNKSSNAWAGNSDDQGSFSSYTRPTGDEDSLFYLFNTLESPQPSSDISDPYAAAAIGNVLSDDLQGYGLKTNLYPYQKRSVAEMIRRESAPKASLDPRLESLEGPTGKEFYFDRDSGYVLSDKRTFDDARGGILAETMGYGKTLICLATILATKDTLPEIPAQHTVHTNRRSTGRGVRPLSVMAAATALRHNVPWKIFFNDLRNNGQAHETSERILKDVAGKYYIHEHIKNRRQNTTLVHKFQILPTTLVVVPPNLLSQWKGEIAKHLEPDAISILVVDNRAFDLPSAKNLGDYDMVLMTRTRFEEETRGRMSWDAPSNYETSVTCRCHISARLCLEHGYRSPLLDAHFLRFIVDEGQGFVSSAQRTHALAGLQSIKVERKWIVSGTPTSGLIGVEVDLAAEESSTMELNNTTELATTDLLPQHILCPSPSSGDAKSSVQKTLTKRRKNPSFEQEKKDIERLGHIVKSFLQLKPWANGVHDGDVANWNVHVVPNSSGTRKPVSLRNVLSSLVVRHRIEDIEADLTLPPLFNKTVRLQPAFIDKLSVNLFILVLATNAITSERIDQDYMFHPKNRSSLEAFIRNMRSSAFFWTGFTEDDIDKTCHAGKKYLDNPQHNVSADDRLLLERAMSIGYRALKSSAWVAFSRRSEIGLYVDNFPKDVDPSWILHSDSSGSHSLIGATQLEAATKFVETNLYASNPFEKLAEAPKEISNIKATGLNVNRTASKKNGSNSEDLAPAKGIPKSSLQDPGKIVGSSISSNSLGNGRKPLIRTGKASKRKASVSETDIESKSILKHSADSKAPIPQSYASLCSTKLIGTSSAKLTYLLNRIIDLEAREKILVFYEADYIAYYCAQALEVLGIPHFIYASGLSLKLRTEYQQMFNTDNIHRVMLMDIKQAAHGLHMASASRVFFVNPVWQANIEAQAIKRAHRIGQTRPVYVETLILEGTIEEQMLERRKSMSTQEQQKASRSLLDDNTMTHLIQNMKLVPFTEEEENSANDHFAPLKKAEQVFARSVASQYTTAELDSAIAAAKAKESSVNAFPVAELPSHPAPKKRKIMFADQAHENSTENSRARPAQQDSGQSRSDSHCVSAQASHLSQLRHSNSTDGLFLWGREPPLNAIEPSRTVRFSEDTSADEEYVE